MDAERRLPLKNFPNIEMIGSLATHYTNATEILNNNNLPLELKYQQVAEQVALMGPLPIKAVQTFIPFARLYSTKLEEDQREGRKVNQEDIQNLHAITLAFDSIRTNFGFIDPEKTAIVIQRSPAVQQGKLEIDQNRLIGHASVSEIYEASSPLLPNKVLVAKVQKPEAKAQYMETFDILKLFFNPEEEYDTEKEMKGKAIAQMMLDVASSGYQSEFNFDLEARALKDLQKIGLKTPHVYPELSSSEILVMDKIQDAIPLLQAAKTKDVNTRKKIAERYLGSIIDMLRHGKLHGDPHGGNVLVDEKNQLHWIDPSPLIEFSKGDIIQTVRLIWHITHGNKSGIIDSLNRLSQNPLEKDAIKRLKDETKDMAEVDFALKIFKDGLSPPDKYITISRSLAETLGTLLELHPERKSLRSWTTLLVRKTVRSFSPI